MSPTPCWDRETRFSGPAILKLGCNSTFDFRYQGDLLLGMIDGIALDVTVNGAEVPIGDPRMIPSSIWVQLRTQHRSDDLWVWRPLPLAARFPSPRRGRCCCWASPGSGLSAIGKREGPSRRRHETHRAAFTALDRASGYGRRAQSGRGTGARRVLAPPLVRDGARFGTDRSRTADGCRPCVSVIEVSKHLASRLGLGRVGRTPGSRDESRREDRAQRAERTIVVAVAGSVPRCVWRRGVIGAVPSRSP